MLLVMRAVAPVDGVAMTVAPAGLVAPQRAPSGKLGRHRDGLRRSDQRRMNGDREPAPYRGCSLRVHRISYSACLPAGPTLPVSFCPEALGTVRPASICGEFPTPIGDPARPIGGGLSTERASGPVRRDHGQSGRRNESNSTARVRPSGSRRVR